MIKNWNRTGITKAIIILLIALGNILTPIKGQGASHLAMILVPYFFGCLGIPLVVIVNIGLSGKKTKKPSWNNNPLKHPIDFFHFCAILFSTIGLSMLIGTGIRFQSINYLGLPPFFLGIGTIVGIFIILKWKQLRIFYFILGGLFMITILLFLMPGSKKDEDIIKHFSEKFDFYSCSLDRIMDQFDDFDFIKDMIYQIRYDDESLSYTILKNYIYRDEIVEIPIDRKSTIDSLLMLMNCKYIDFVEKKYVKLYTEIENSDFFHVRILKIIDDNILNDKYKNWELLEEGDLPTKKNNWLFHLKDNWYIESRIKYKKDIKNDYPYESELTTDYSYDDGKLKSIGRQYIREENGELEYLNHGLWLHLDSNEFIIKEEIFYYDSLVKEIEYKISERRKIGTDTVICATRENGEWEEEKCIEYIID